MNQRKQKKLNKWRKALEDYELVGEYNNGTHLRYKVGQRSVDVWPTTGKFRVNHGPTYEAGNPGKLLAFVLELEDAPPESGQVPAWLGGDQEQPGTMANVVQFKHFVHDADQSVWEQANIWLASTAGSVQYVDAKPILHPGHNEELVLVYKILTEI